MTQKINMGKKEQIMYGQLHLMFELKRGQTRLIECYQTPPLKASRTLYIDGNHKATVYLMESSGGLVAGDYNEFHVHVKKGGAVLLKPQSATKIYPSYNYKPCYQNFSIILENNARLEWNKDELIPFKDAIYNGKNIIQMSSTSTLLWGEIIYPGREKRGEQFQYNKVKTHFEVWVDKTCITRDCLVLIPKKQYLQGIGVLEHFKFIGSIWFISPRINNLNEHLFSKLFIQTSDHFSGISRLNGNGILIRWLSNNLPLLKKEMENVFEVFTREDIFNKEGEN